MRGVFYCKINSIIIKTFPAHDKMNCIAVQNAMNRLPPKGQTSGKPTLTY